LWPAQAASSANYWAFTLTDGALRMLVVFHYHALGYSTLAAGPQGEPQPEAGTPG
jgi:hypothetical protein